MDRDALRTLRGAGAALGIAPAGAVNLLAPRAIVRRAVAAGAVASAVAGAEGVAPQGAGRPVVVGGVGLGSGGALLGAAHSVIRALLDDPASSAGSAGDV
ncbi:hypothetical protein ACFWOY_28160 [Streptomyces sp. NPDC058423]|uniref:hypothetical protein n=1 Tax=unclassified Streptomyces TaxID=2593676 RepID=UPI00364EDFD4